MLPGDLPATPDEAAERVLKALDDTTSVTVDGTTRVAGHDAYKLRFAPKQSGSTVDAVTIAVDADNGAPLRFSLTAKDGGKPVFDIGYTEVSFARPAAKSFTFTPPKGTKVTEGREEHHWVKGDGHRGNWHRRGEGRGPAGLGLDALGPGGLGPGAPAGGNVKVTGKAWSTVIEARLPDGGLDGTVKGRHRDLPEGLDAGSLLKGFGDEVKGRFGSGTMIHTRLVNVLITDDGRVLAGAVTKDTLVKAAGK